MSWALRRVSLFFFLFAVFYLPFFLSHGDRVLSEWVVTTCANFYEANPLGLLPENFVIGLNFIVGGVVVIGFLVSDRHPTLAAVLVFFWSLYVFMFGVALHTNILKLSYAGCMWHGSGG